MNLRKLQIYTACALFAPIFMSQQIAPVLLGAIIYAGAALAGGLMSNMAQNEQEKQKKLAEAESKGYETEAQGYRAEGAASQDTFGQMMDGYRASLIR